MEIPTNTRDRFGQDLLRYWHAAHGNSAGSAEALSGSGLLAVFLEQIFSPAERKLASDQQGEILLRHYYSELADQIASQMMEHFQQNLGKIDPSYSVNINPIDDQIRKRAQAPSPFVKVFLLLPFERGDLR